MAVLHCSPIWHKPTCNSLFALVVWGMVFMGLFLPDQANGQDDLMETLENETADEETVDYTLATFKDNRIINGHSVETPAGGVLQFVVSHRFGRVTDGVQQFFGLDNATVHLRLKYSPTDRLTIGGGRSSFENTYDGYLKYRLLWQSKGKRNMPISLTLFSDMAINTLQWQNPERDNKFSSRLYYTYQALIARKFKDWLSLQLTPTLVHRNTVELEEDHNDVYALGAGTSVKLTGSIRLNAEYFYVPEGQIISKVNAEEAQDAVSIGLDIETGGHVFQLHFTNARGMVPKIFVTQTTGDWLEGEFHFGFNISRVFTLQRDHPHHKKWGW